MKALKALMMPTLHYITLNKGMAQHQRSSRKARRNMKQENQNKDDEITVSIVGAIIGMKLIF
jgi:hypothetical protein